MVLCLTFLPVASALLQVGRPAVRSPPRTLASPEGFEVESPRGPTWNLTGAIELHRLVLEDYAQLERRAGELKAEFINSTCTRDGNIKEVS